jgi:hypothetical protein
MSLDTIFYNFLFFFIVIAVAVIGWVILYGIRRKNRKKLDDATMVNGMCQTGLNHRFNTPERRR